MSQRPYGPGRNKYFDGASGVERRRAARKAEHLVPFETTASRWQVFAGFGLRPLIPQYPPIGCIGDRREHFVPGGDCGQIRQIQVFRGRTRLLAT